MGYGTLKGLKNYWNSSQQMFPNNEVFIYDTFGVNIKIGICNSKTNHFLLMRIS
jgi:hypothetical protein